MQSFSDQEFKQALTSRAKRVNGSLTIDLESLREFAFDVRLTEEQHEKVMEYIRPVDKVFNELPERITEWQTGGVTAEGIKWEYNR